MSETIRFIVVTLKDGTVHSFPQEDVDLVELVTGTILWKPHGLRTKVVQEWTREEMAPGSVCSGCGLELANPDDFGMCVNCSHEASLEAEERLPPTQTTLGDFAPSTRRPCVHSGEMPEDVQEWLANREAGILAPHPRPQQSPDNWVRMRSCRRCGAQRRRCLKSLGYRCNSCLDLDPLEDF